MWRVTGKPFAIIRRLQPCVVAGQSLSASHTQLSWIIRAENQLGWCFSALVVILALFRMTPFSCIFGITERERQNTRGKTCTAARYILRLLASYPLSVTGDLEPIAYKLLIRDGNENWNFSWRWQRCRYPYCATKRDLRSWDFFNTSCNFFSFRRSGESRWVTTCLS